jgi:hypothetical protein
MTNENLFMVVIYSFHHEMGYTFPDYAQEMRKDFDVTVSCLSEHWVRVIGTKENMLRFIEECTELDRTQLDSLENRSLFG